MEKYNKIQITIDEREGSLYDQIQQIFLKKSPNNVLFFNIVKKVIPLGDVLIDLIDPDTSNKIPILLIERKTFSDLLSSIKDGRYQEQSHRLVHTGEYHPHNILYLIEGIANQVALKDISIAYSAIVSLNLYKGFSIYKTATVQESAEFIFSMAQKIIKNKMERKELPKYFIQKYDQENEIENSIIYRESSIPSFPPPSYSSVVKKEKKENISPENIGEIFLCQIPGISHITAQQIMEKYKTIRNLIESLVENPNCLDNISLNTSNGTSRRKISQTTIQNIKKFLVSNEM